MAKRRQTLGDRMRAEIRARGWSNAEVAKQAKLTEAMVSRFMRRQTDPRLDSVEKLFALLGWDVGPISEKDKS
jgi:transcriptional regulator with XRE-family HTH domain